MSQNVSFDYDDLTSESSETVEVVIDSCNSTNDIDINIFRKRHDCTPSETTNKINEMCNSLRAIGSWFSYCNPWAKKPEHKLVQLLNNDDLEILHQQISDLLSQAGNNNLNLDVFSGKLKEGATAENVDLAVIYKAITILLYDVEQLAESIKDKYRTNNIGSYHAQRDYIEQIINKHEFYTTAEHNTIRDSDITKIISSQNEIYASNPEDKINHGAITGCFSHVSKLAFKKLATVDTLKTGARIIVTAGLSLGKTGSSFGLALNGAHLGLDFTLKGIFGIDAPWLTTPLGYGIAGSVGFVIFVTRTPAIWQKLDTKNFSSKELYSAFNKIKNISYSDVAAKLFNRTECVTTVIHGGAFAMSTVLCLVATHLGGIKFGGTLGDAINLFVESPAATKASKVFFGYYIPVCAFSSNLFFVQPSARQGTKNFITNITSQISSIVSWPTTYKDIESESTPSFSDLTFAQKSYSLALLGGKLYVLFALPTGIAAMDLTNNQGGFYSITGKEAASFLTSVAFLPPSIFIRSTSLIDGYDRFAQSPSIREMTRGMSWAGTFTVWTTAAIGYVYSFADFNSSIAGVFKFLQMSNNLSNSWFGMGSRYDEVNEFLSALGAWRYPIFVGAAILAGGKQLSTEAFECQAMKNDVYKYFNGNYTSPNNVLYFHRECSTPWSIARNKDTEQDAREEEITVELNNYGTIG